MRFPPSCRASPPLDLRSARSVNAAKPQLQDLFLAAAAREHERMTLFLVNGVMLQGAVTGFDQFSLAARARRPGAAGLQARTSRRSSRRIRSISAASMTAERGGRGLNSFDGTGAIDVARGERAIIAVPGASARRLATLGRGARRRRRKGSPRRSVSRSSRRGRCACGRVRPATLLGKGQVEEIAELAKEQRRRTADRRCRADARSSRRTSRTKSAPR